MDERTIELFKDEAFLKKVLVMEPEEAQKAFAEAGGTITVDELKDIAAQVNKFITSNGELDEGSLEEVTGGAKAATIKFAVGVAVGIAIVCAPW